MEMTLGPQGIDWGNAADWISILVNVFVGVSVFWLGHRTYQLTQQATERENKAYESQNAQESREGRLLLSLFRSEIGHFRMQLEKAADYLAVDAKENGLFISDREFIELITRLDLPSVWRKQGRLHILPDTQAVLLVGLIGSILPLRKLVESAARVDVSERDEGEGLLRRSITKLIERATSAEQICIEARQSFNAEP